MSALWDRFYYTVKGAIFVHWPLSLLPVAWIVGDGFLFCHAATS